MDELIDEIKKNWNDVGFLERVLLDLVTEYRNQASSYASAVMAEASTFNAEMEDTFKPSVTKAEYKAKELSGSSKIIAEREMRAVELLYEAVKTRIVSLNKIDKS